MRKIQDGKEEIIPFVDDRAEKDIYSFWTLITDSTSTDEFIVIYGHDENDDEIVFDYYKTSTDLSADGDVSIIPDPYAMDVLAPLVAGQLLYYSDERSNGVSILRKGYSKLQQMYSNYGVRTKEYRKTVKTKSFDLGTV